MNIYKKSTRKALGFMSAVALAASSLALTGCNDFLDEPVKGNSIDKNYYDTTYKLQAALNATYDILQSDAIGGSGRLAATIWSATTKGLPRIWGSW